MKHEKYKELLELNVLGELTKDEEIELENHLFECNECSEEYNEIKKMYALISTEQPPILSDDELLSSRGKLFTKINSEVNQPNILEKINELWSSLFLNNYSIAFSSIILILFGMFAGYLIFSSYASSPQLLTSNIIDLDKIDNGDIKISDVNFPEIFNEEGQFEFKLSGYEPINYKGNLNDVAVQRLLASAIKETDNPGFKLRTANTIADLMKDNYIMDEEIKEAFIFTLKTDENPGVRKGALKALLSFPFDSKIRDVLLFTLSNDKNASNRMDAISALLSMNLDSSIDENTIRKLNENVKNEENEVIKFKTTKLLIGGK